jgi:hypothetical protein
MLVCKVDKELLKIILVHIFKAKYIQQTNAITLQTPKITQIGCYMNAPNK